MAARFVRLDRPAIRRLLPGQSATEHGITVERLVDGDLRYYVNVMVDGQRIHRVIGLASERVTRSQCEEFIEQARTEARSGRLNLPNRRKLALTFGAAADDYLKRLDAGAGRNMAVKRRQLRMYLRPFLGPMRLDAISDFTIERYKKQRLAAGASPATVNRELATLSHLFTNTVSGAGTTMRRRVKKLGESAGRIVALTDAECDSLLQAAIASADPDLWLFVEFGLNTGMRHGEILAARWDQLDLGRRRLFVPKAKAGQREQPITPELAEILRRERDMREDRTGWIFPSPRKDSAMGHRARMDRPFREAVTAAGLDPELVTPHVMRHTAITKLVQAGVDLPTVQRISGHKTMAMVLRYSHVHSPHIDDAIRALGRTLPEPAGNEAASAITQELHTRARRQARSRSAAGRKL